MSHLLPDRAGWGEATPLAPSGSDVAGWLSWPQIRSPLPPWLELEPTPSLLLDEALTQAGSTGHGQGAGPQDALGGVPLALHGELWCVLEAWIAGRSLNCASDSSSVKRG